MLRTMRVRTTPAVLLVAAAGLAAERTRPPMPKITKPLMFDTPEADAVLAALQVFPADNWWNRDISALPVHEHSPCIADSHDHEDSASSLLPKLESSKPRGFGELLT